MACAAALLARVFAAVDLRAVGSVLVQAGPRAPLALAPFVLGMAADAAGMGAILGALGRRLTLGDPSPLRVATEALHMTAPAGFLVADTTTAAILGSRWAVPLGEGAVLAVARKWLVMRAHAAYILFGTAVGSAALAAVSQRFFGTRWIGVAVAAALAVVPFVLSVTVGLGFAGRSALESVRAAVERLPWRALREKVRSFRRGATAGDALLARVGADRRATRLASLGLPLLLGGRGARHRGHPLDRHGSVRRRGRSRGRDGRLHAPFDRQRRARRAGRAGGRLRRSAHGDGSARRRRRGLRAPQALQGAGVDRGGIRPARQHSATARPFRSVTHT